MKKLGKLSINESKLLENEELVNLRGGYYGYGKTNCCECWNGIIVVGYIVGTTMYDCMADCEFLGVEADRGLWVC